LTKTTMTTITHKSFFVALLLTSGSAERMPTFSFIAKHNKLGAVPSEENSDIHCSIEKQLTNQLGVGGNVALGSTKESFRVENLFARVSNVCLGNGGCHANGNIQVSTSGDNSFKGNIEVNHCCKGISTRASLNSEADGYIPYVDKVQFTQQHYGWQITPTVHMKDLSVDMEAVAEMEDLVTMVGVDHTGKSKFTIAKSMNQETQFKVSSDDGFSNIEYQMARSIGDHDIISPSFHSKGNNFKLNWLHRFKAVEVQTSIDQAEKKIDVEVSGQDENSLSMKLSSPWDSPQDAGVTFSSKISPSKFNFFKKK